MSIPRFSADAAYSDIASALGEEGCAVVSGVTDIELRRAIVAELEAHINKARIVENDDPAQFYPGHTRRVTALAARSEQVTDHLIAHPLTQQVCDAHLLQNNNNSYQLHVSAALSIGPGARKQILHREEDPFTFFPLPRPKIIVASMWALSDFHEENGATLLVPGSHRWVSERKARDSEVVSAEMSAGSVLFWMGGTLHAAGSNTTSQDWRYGLILTYSLSWVRQEENQYMAIPPHRLKEISPEIRSLLGFEMYQGLGFYDPTVS